MVEPEWREPFDKRDDLIDFEWSLIEPLLPNMPHGIPRKDDRCVLNGIMRVRLRSGASGESWRSAAGFERPATTAIVAGARMESGIA